MFNSIKMWLFSMLLMLGMLSADAMAALPAAVAGTVTGIQTDGQALFDLLFPVIATFVGLVVIVKLFKRFTNKV
ncbi:MAG: hypothetical protein PHU14_08155 [Methylovulum sp.]|nr:hypothetical protein [Methylovulum sp.]